LDIADEVQGALRQIDRVAAQWLVNIEFAIQPQLALRASPRMLRQLLTELLTHTIIRASGGSLLLTVVQAPGWVQIGITDDNSDPDYRLLENSLRPTAELLALHGGSLEIAPRPGLGATVVARLPSKDPIDLSRQATQPDLQAADDATLMLLRGTHIATPEGDVPVEALAAHSLVVTPSRSTVRIKQVVPRSFGEPTPAQQLDQSTICVRRHAIGPALPRRDLFLPRDQLVVIERTRIPAAALINHATIVQTSPWQAADCFELALERPTVLLVEGVAIAALRCEAARTDDRTEPAGRETAIIQRRLAGRAAAMGFASLHRHYTGQPEFQLLVGGRTLSPVTFDQGVYVFSLPPDPGDVRLLPSADPPDHTGTSGIAIRRIVLRTGERCDDIPLDHPGLGEGWQALEQANGRPMRWINASAVVPLPTTSPPGSSVLEVHLVGELKCRLDNAVPPLDRIALPQAATA
jgi:Hint domain